MGVTLTEAAAKHVADQLTSRGKGLGIRLGITTSGCSGMAYVLEFVDEQAPEDQVFEGHVGGERPHALERRIGLVDAFEQRRRSLRALDTEFWRPRIWSGVRAGGRGRVPVVGALRRRRRISFSSTHCFCRN